MNNKVEELINTLDPDRIQCIACRKWFHNPFWKIYKFNFNEFLCHKCKNKSWPEWISHTNEERKKHEKSS